MFEYRDHNDTSSHELLARGPQGPDFPEPLDSWRIEDFEDLLGSHA